jgi:3-oxoacyl-[acyl-carrier protein] reductase
MESKPVALITGASRGIGRAIAVALSGAGYDCALSARSAEALAESAALCPGRTETFAADLSAAGAPEELADAVVGKMGRVDVLVNNAGAALSKPFEETNTADWDALMALNARSPFLLTRALLPALRRSETATIVNIGSVVSHKGYQLQAAYAASKHALAGWTKSLAGEVAPEGIRVHLVTPGGVATEMVLGVRPDIDPEDLIRPEEIAEAVLFLVEKRGNAVIDELRIHRKGKAPFA